MAANFIPQKHCYLAVVEQIKVYCCSIRKL